MINQSNIEAYLNQRHIISIIFFILRDKCHYISPEDRKNLKYTLKSAQRQLEFIRNEEPGSYFGTQPNLIQFIKTLYANVIISRQIACRLFGYHNITIEQQKLLHKNQNHSHFMNIEQAKGRANRN